MATPIPKNSAEFALSEIVSATGGQLSGDETIATRSVSIDTRAIEAGALFVALRGENGDGHQYLARAAQAGAAAAVVERGRRDPALPCIEVDDTLLALGRIARYHMLRTRDFHPIPCIAIGGAAGKTTTKEITAALARDVFGPTLATSGNLNNLIGVPMTLLTLGDEHNAMVIECGTNARGEIPRLAAIVEPDVALIINVDLEHTEGLGTLEDIADEESAIWSCTRKVAVHPFGDKMLAPRRPSRLRAITFGTAEDADVVLAERSVASNGRTWIYVELDPALVAHGVDPVVRKEIGLVGSVAAMNCTAAIAAIAAAAPIPLDFQQLRAMERALAGIEPVPGRLALTHVGGVVLIDDAYNAQPPSVRAGLEAAREVAHGRGARLVLALGDMLELGAMAKAAHAEVLRQVQTLRPAVLIAVGPEMCAAVKAAEGLAGEVRCCAESDEAARILPPLVKRGDVVLVKGSLGIKMGRVVDALNQSLGAR
jgi:UDP-N-acetylmuramoyl-tripeptide--D-alanyl-D-alanine ligase